jgi:hypothetical protein
MLRQFKYAEDILLGNTITEDYQEQILSILKGLPFWLWDKEQHTAEYIRTSGQCCWNHIVGLPTKDHKEYPLFDYEKLLYDSLLTNDGSFKDNISGVLNPRD